MARKFRSGIALPPIDEVAAVEQRATRLASDGKVDEAIEKLSDLLLKNPRRTDILVCMTRILVAASRLLEAVDVLNVLKTHLPDNPEVRRLLGSVLLQMRRLPFAEPELLEAIRLDPKDVAARSMLSQLYEQWGRDQESATAITEAVAIKPFDVELTCAAVGLLHHGGRDQEAHELLLRAPTAVSSRPEMRFVEAVLMPIIPSSVAEIQERRAHMSRVLQDLRQEGKPFKNPEFALQHSNFHLGYHGLEDRDLLEQTSQTLLQLAPDLDYVSPRLDRKSTSNRRIRVGFLSAHMQIGRAHV